MKTTSLLIALAALCLSALPVSAEATKRSESLPDLVASVMPSVVMIENRGLTGGEEPRVIDELGSGFIVDPSRIIATNRHVIEGAYAISVNLSDGTHLSAKLLGKAATFDIALLKVDAGRPLPPVKIGDSDKLRIGDPVFAIGNPLGFERTVTSGVVSAFHRDLGTSIYDDLIQTDVPINHGNSGGPLFNMAGEVVGINQAISTQNQGGSIGISFSIPSKQTEWILDNVKRYGEPRVGYLGITGTALSPAMLRAIDLNEPGGVIVSSVASNSPAAMSGMQVGDVILKVGDLQITSKTELNRGIARLADQTVMMQIVRGGKMMAIPVGITRVAGELWITVLPEPRRIRSVADLGLDGLANGGDGVYVTTIMEKSVAWAAGIRPGDIIQKVQFDDVRTVDDLNKKLAEFEFKGVTDAIVLVTGQAGPRWVNLSVKEW